MRLYAAATRSTKNSCGSFASISMVCANVIFFSTLAVIFSARTGNGPGSLVTPNVFVNKKVLKENYNGTPQKRRNLALHRESATKNDWEILAASILERGKKVSGVYALHVSKSGGTSLCDRFKEEKCYIPFDKLGKHNCWANEYKTEHLDLGPQWVRKETANMLGFKRWVNYDENVFHSPLCSDLLEYLRKRGQMVAMSENTIPMDGICQDSMTSLIIIRDPMSRIISHFRHLLTSFDSSKKCQDTSYASNSTGTTCPSLIKSIGTNSSDDDIKYFNITTMINYFDIMADNFYMRSLNDASVYGQALGFDGNADTYLDQALHNLRKFDWVMVLGSQQMDESKNNDLILKNGLGLDGGLGKSRVAKGGQLIQLTKEDEHILRKLNSYDETIWEEAKKLNALDIISLQQLLNHGGDRWKERVIDAKNTSRCCGYVCD